MTLRSNDRWWLLVALFQWLINSIDEKLLPYCGSAALQAEMQKYSREAIFHQQNYQPLEQSAARSHWSNDRRRLWSNDRRRLLVALFQWLINSVGEKLLPYCGSAALQAKMQNHSKEAIFHQQNYQPLEQSAARSHWRHHREYFQEPTGQDVQRYGHQQLRSYLAHQLQVQVSMHVAFKVASRSLLATIQVENRSTILYLQHKVSTSDLLYFLRYCSTKKA